MMLPSEKRRINKHMYDATISSIQTLLDQTSNITDQIAILDYSINVIGRDISHSVAADMLYGGNDIGDDAFCIPQAYLTNVSGGDERYTRQTNVVSATYDPKKLSSAISDVYLYGFRQEFDNRSAVYYPEINLTVIENGKHHLSAANTINAGSAMLSILSLKSAFPILRTDGERWKVNGADEGSVVDYRIAVLYELARIKDSLNAPDDMIDFFENVPLVPPKKEWSPCSPSDSEQLYVANLELELKNLWISILRQQIDCESEHPDFKRWEDEFLRIDKDIAEFKAMFSPQNKP